MSDITSGPVTTLCEGAANMKDSLSCQESLSDAGRDPLYSPILSSALLYLPTTRPLLHNPYRSSCPHSFFPCCPSAVCLSFCLCYRKTNTQQQLVPTRAPMGTNTGSQSILFILHSSYCTAKEKCSTTPLILRLKTGLPCRQA